MRFSKEELIEKLKSLNKTNISKSEINSNPNLPSAATYKRYFGSWSKAVEAAELQTGIITGRPQDPAIILSEKALDIIEGELLGDGTIECAPTMNAGFSLSSANFDYIRFTMNALISENVPIQSLSFLASRNNSKPQLRVRTKVNISFREIRNKWYVGKTKIIPNDLILNKTRCLHWYLGDGYFEDNTCKISTCGFSKDEVLFLAEKLTNLGFKTTINKRSGGYFILRISRYVFQDFLNWIGKCPVKGYEHRWGGREI